jgi:uncharacterized membrane protein
MRLPSQVMDRNSARHNVGPAERWASALLGGALVWAGLRRRGLSGWAMALSGGAMIQRGATGHCAVYESLGLDSSGSPEIDQPPGPRLHAEATATIARPRQEVYEFFRDLEALGQFLPHVRSVRPMDDGTWCWSCDTTDDQCFESYVRITQDLPQERIGWRSGEDDAIAHRGAVSFSEAGPRGTIVRAEIQFSRPVRLAWAMRRWPTTLVASALRLVKQYLETGEVTTAAPSLGQADRQTRNWLSLTRRPDQPDVVEEASEESFPASDTPARTTPAPT